MIERPELSLLFELATLYRVDYQNLLREMKGPTGARQRHGSRSVETAALRAVGQLNRHQQIEALDFMSRLRRPPRPGDPDLSERTRERIAALADHALQLANAADRIPTPLADVAKAVGVAEIHDISKLPKTLEAKKPPAWKRILGAVRFKDRVIYVDQNEGGGVGRRNFTTAHETAHVLLPWHAQAFRLDDERTLFLGATEELEAEANWAAAHLIFQGSRYHRRALGNQVSIRTPIALARDYEASVHASIRYYVQHHPEPVAALVAGRYTQFDGTLPVWNSIESPSFLERYGRLLYQLPGGTLQVEGDPPLLGRLAAAALANQASDPPTDKTLLASLSGDRNRFIAEAFFNHYTVFLMVAAQRATRLGRRLRIESG